MYDLCSVSGMSSLLGKRPPSSHPTGSPLPTGELSGADDVPAAPAAKAAAKPDLEERFERLLESFVELKAQVALVPDLHQQISKLTQQVAEGKAAQKELSLELAAVRLWQARWEPRVVRLEKQVTDAEKNKPSASYAQALGGQAGADLRKQQDDLTGTVKQLGHQVEQQERQVRARNVMMFSLAEGSETPLQQVTACLQAAGVSGAAKIVQAVRLGVDRRASTGVGPSRPRPVKIVMPAPADAIGLLRHTRRLRQSQHVNIDRDLTPQQSQQRKAQEGAARELRQQGYVTEWRGDQLIFADTATNKREVYRGRIPRRA